MLKRKAAIIGAGSTYTPELIEGLINKRESLPFDEIYLMDIDRTKLEIVGGLAKRMLTHAGLNGNIILTGDLDEAVAGSDYVFAQIRVGGLQARIWDEKIPLKYGLLGQETTGAGGFMNALRTIPAVLDIASSIERSAPDAWLINFSNPSGIVAEAVLNHTNIKMIGLCNGPVNVLAAIAERLGTSDFDYEYVGLNHLNWVTSIMVDGKSVLEDSKQDINANMKNIPDTPYDDALYEAIPFIPSGYLSYYYLRDKQLQKCMAAEKSRGEICIELEKSLLAQYKDPQLNVKPKELALRGGARYSTAAISLVDAIENDKNEFHVVNVINGGALPFLGKTDVAEMKCLVNRKGAAPIPVSSPQSPYVVGLVQAVKAYERLTVEAAVKGSREAALAALMVHPLIGDYDKAKAVLEDMLKANARLLPRFSA